MAPDGSGQRRISSDLTHGSDAAWSPDGRRLAVVALHEQGTVIDVMDADGSNVQTLSDGPDNSPAWSPDGAWIAFSSNRDGHDEIYLMRSDGSDERRLTISSDSNWHPSWSPDGATIAYTSYVDGHEQLMLMDSDGANQRRLRVSDQAEFTPVWSPDGTQLAFVGSIDFGNLQIHIMNADGSNVRNLSNNEFSEYDPAWSPDGTTIAFTRGSFMEDDIFVMDADGSNVRQLTDAPHSDTAPSWSPDGSLIAFTSNRDGGQPVSCSWSASDLLAGIESMEIMTWMAHQVVVGTIVEQLPPAFGDPLNPEFEPSLPIYTDYLFKVERRFRGHPVDTLRIRQSGGAIGDCVQTVEPLAPLAVGQRIVLFLTEERPSSVLPPAYYITGGPQGWFEIEADETILNGLGDASQPMRMTLDEVGALVAETLAAGPPANAFEVVSLEDAPPAGP